MGVSCEMHSPFLTGKPKHSQKIAHYRACPSATNDKNISYLTPVVKKQHKYYFSMTALVCYALVNDNTLQSEVMKAHSQQKYAPISVFVTFDYILEFGCSGIFLLVGCSSVDHQNVMSNQKGHMA